MQNYKASKRQVAIRSDSTQTNAVPSKIQRKKSTKSRKHRIDTMMRFNICLPRGLVERIDAAAEQDYTSRSDMIRTAILWYLRPQGRDLDQADPKVILKTLEHRRARVGMKEMTKGLNIND